MSAPRIEIDRTLPSALVTTLITSTSAKVSSVASVTSTLVPTSFCGSNSSADSGSWASFAPLGTRLPVTGRPCEGSITLPCAAAVAAQPAQASAVAAATVKPQ